MLGKRLPSVTRKMTDESDTRRFRFTFYCDCCGVGYETNEILFSDTEAPRSLEDFSPSGRWIWDAEHEDAYERGNRSAMLVFNPCEICGISICETCGGELEDDTICPDCRQKQRMNR